MQPPSSESDEEPKKRRRSASPEVCPDINLFLIHLTKVQQASNKAARTEEAPSSARRSSSVVPSPSKAAPQGPALSAGNAVIAPASSSAAEKPNAPASSTAAKKPSAPASSSVAKKPSAPASSSAAEKPKAPASSTAVKKSSAPAPNRGDKSPAPASSSTAKQPTTSGNPSTSKPSNAASNAALEKKKKKKKNNKDSTGEQAVAPAAVTNADQSFDPQNAYTTDPAFEKQMQNMGALEDLGFEIGGQEEFYAASPVKSPVKTRPVPSTATAAETRTPPPMDVETARMVLAAYEARIAAPAAPKMHPTSVTSGSVKPSTKSATVIKPVRYTDNLGSSDEDIPKPKVATAVVAAQVRKDLKQGPAKSLVKGKEKATKYDSPSASNSNSDSNSDSSDSDSDSSSSASSSSVSATSEEEDRATRKARYAAAGYSKETAKRIRKQEKRAREEKHWERERRRKEKRRRERQREKERRKAGKRKQHKRPKEEPEPVVVYQRGKSKASKVKEVKKSKADKPGSFTYYKNLPNGGEFLVEPLKRAFVRHMYTNPWPGKLARIQFCGDSYQYGWTQWAAEMIKGTPPGQPVPPGKPFFVDLHPLLTAFSSLCTGQRCALHGERIPYL